jgi:hypothetical protein
VCDCLCADADDILIILRQKFFVLQAFLQTNKNILAKWQVSFFSQEARQTKSFALG